MRLAPSRLQRASLSLVAMIDVLMILLFFFMVTSTYLDLDMVPLVEGSGDDAPPAPDATGPAGPGNALLIRLGSDGQAFVQGRAQPANRLVELIAERLTRNPALEVVILPSGQANAQALAWLMDASAAAGAERLRILRIEALP
jgi:biopolymer transport protein ExbD